MITAMKKLFLVVHNEAAPGLVNNLQDKGVVHVEHEDVKNEEITGFLKQKTRLLNFVKGLPKDQDRQQKSYDGDVEELIRDFEDTVDKRDNVNSKRNRLKKDHKQLIPWGKFDPTLVKKLRDEANIVMGHYSIPLKKLNEIDMAKNHLEEVFCDSTRAYVVKIDEGEEQPLEHIEKLVLPEMDVTLCEQRIQESDDELKKIQDIMLELSCYKDFVESEIHRLNDKLNNKKALVSLKDHYEKISTIIGWIPKAKHDEVKSFLENEEGIVYEINDPEDEDVIPIHLKNGPFSKLFEPITGLFALPSYMEFDLTPFFAPFFALFFGLCLGDAGYGLVLLGVTTFAFFKYKKFRPVILLAMILSLTTIFWGVLTGTTFGLNLFETKLPVLSKLAYLKSNHVFYLALLIGLFQILFGMAVQTISRLFFKRDLSGLSTFGWFLLVLFGSVWYLKTQGARPEGFAIGAGVIDFCQTVSMNLLYGLMGAGTFMILFFNDMKVNIFLRFGKGLWELYGITGVAGDLLSYIRLFALGISSAILGTVINSIALQILEIPVPVLSHVLFILFLVGGHVGNLLLAALGSFVHPLRLTFVEFYKNAGFEGGGKPYSPLRREFSKSL
jgi:V/A-type H+-transporting ATPase subunit I